MAGTTVLACRVGDELFAYHDRCGSCDDSLAGAALHRGWDRRSATRCCAARGAARISTSCTPAHGVDATRRRSISSRSRCWCATACCRWRCRRSVRAVMCMNGAYDVLARIRANRAAPQPAGERCEMCCGADRRRTPACRECRRPTADVRVSRLLSAVHRHRTPQLRYRAVPDRYLALPGFRARTAASGRRCRFRSGWRSSSATRRLDRTVGVLSRARRAPPNPSWICRRGTIIRTADAAGGHARRRHRSAAGAGARRRAPPRRVLSGADRCLLRVRRAAADAVARLRRRPGCPRVHRRVLRRDRRDAAEASAW